MVTGEAPPMPAETDAGAGGAVASDPVVLVAASSGPATGVTAAIGAADLVGSSRRFFSGFGTSAFLEGASTPRGATIADATTGTANGGAGTTAGCGLGAT
jgi:hypothetical protein